MASLHLHEMLIHRVRSQFLIMFTFFAYGKDFSQKHVRLRLSCLVYHASPACANAANNAAQCRISKSLFQQSHAFSIPFFSSGRYQIGC